jgi:bifunctional non-homologous end joining protein LigD
VTPSEATEVDVDGRRLRLTNLEKVLYPKTGFTKGNVIDYYTRIAPVLLPHLRNRPLTLKRYPNGVEGHFFYEKQCPKHRPDWVQVQPIQGSQRVVEFCLANDKPTLVWVANLASLELHPLLSTSESLSTPTKLTFDLDPGPPASIVECSKVAMSLRALLGDLGLGECFAKTSGSKGMQVDVPLNTPTSFDATKIFAKTVARFMEKDGLVVSKMEKAVRKNKVLVDWSQNDQSKTTVSVYSLRAKDEPTVSTPISWDEVEDCAGGKMLSFTTDEVLDRVERLGDLHEPVTRVTQNLPEPPSLD